MHIELFAVVLSLCASGLSLPTAECAGCKPANVSAPVKGLATNNLFDIFTSKGEEEAAKPPSVPVQPPVHAEENSVFGMFQSFFNTKNATSPELDAKQKLEEEKSRIPPAPTAPTLDPHIPQAAGKEIDAINSKYRDFIKHLSPEKPEPPKPVNLFDGIGNLAHGLAEAGKVSENISKDIKVASQVQLLELKALNKAKNILQKNPDILINAARLIDTVPESLDFNDPESILKTVQAVQKLNPELSSQVHTVLKDLKLDEQLIPVDYINKITHAIENVTDQFAQP
ncbi:hypothetical protein DSO57_1027517 [Entomophthora muscae]|uniref:Uncharacterized protein n=1 Tax=Entomophthora muscae TaxID=34485 RepID=A0ACC2UMH9_9FUNG|nr:hypothetical protein DSO57_1027517 [Entomophthora muscae]